MHVRLPPSFRDAGKRPLRRHGMLFVAQQSLSERWMVRIASLAGEAYGVAKLDALQGQHPIDPWLVVGVCSDLRDGYPLLGHVRTLLAPITLILTSNVEPKVGAALLTAGADLWLPSAADPELIAALVASTRRRVASTWATPNQDARWESGSSQPHHVYMDQTTLLLRIGSHCVAMQAIPFQICRYLVRHRERWVSSVELRAAVLATGFHSSESLVRVHIHQIRKALGQYQDCIQSQRFAGYRFVDPQLPQTQEQGTAANTLTGHH